ncbi:MAG: VOC family protein [Armatimonadetes bacterium]|nr:VOC family protein [Armatimonadota bacterium]
MTSPTLGLVVLRAADVDRMLAFYHALGLEFVQERHGNGPIHYSCDLGGTIIEIYPGKSGVAPDRRSGGATMLGFQVVSLDATLAAA